MHEFLEQGNTVLDPYRTLRIGPFSALDLVGSYLVIFFLAPYLSKLFARIGIKITRLEWLSLTLPIALAVHLLAGFDTPFTRMFLAEGVILPKLVITLMLIFGLRSAVKSLGK